MLLNDTVRPLLEVNDSDADEEFEEGQPAKGIKWNQLPSEAEVRLHNLTHLPFRDWCPFCVQGRAVSHPHYKVKEESKIPVISMDYMGLTEREPNDELFPILVIYDRKSSSTFAHVLPKKGVSEHGVARTTQDRLVTGMGCRA